MNEGLPGRAWSDLRAHLRQPLAFHLAMQLLGFAIFTPVLTFVAQRMVLAAGDPVITNYDIARFVLSPTGAAFVTVVAAVALGLLLAELAGLTWIAGHAIARRPVTVPSTVAFVVRKLPRLILLSTHVFLRLLVLALPFLAVAGLVWFTMLGGHDDNYYLAENPPEWRRAKLLAVILGVVYALLAVWQLARWLYALPILAFDGAASAEALAASARMSKGRIAAIVTPLVLWWLLLTMATVAITWACRHVTDASLDWAGIDVHRVLPLVALFLTVTVAGGFLYSGLHLAGHQFLVVRMYAEQRDPGRWQVPAAPEADTQRSWVIAHPVIATFALLGLACGVAGVLAARLDVKEDVAVTAHRGASTSVPENTMAAFRAALEAGATYTELDVQHTRDRQIVVIHDGDLMRMAGDPRKVAELTAAELATIDIGRKHGGDFAGERVPTLEQVIDLVRGRTKINIELKYNVPDPGLAAAVVDLLRRKDFLDQVVITSLDYAALKQVESIEPRLKTGHIVTASVGNVLRTEADFLSLSSARAEPSLVRRAHAAGKEVHVWTVNKPEVMLRMIERGVDNVITDDPALLVRVMQERNALSTPEILGLRLRVLFDKPPPEVTDPASVERL